MVKAISLSDMLHREGNSLKSLRPGEIKIIMDASALKYKYRSTIHEVIITPSVLRQVRNNPSDEFPQEQINKTLELLNPQYYSRIVRAHEQYLISLATLDLPKAFPPNDIGSTDIEQIAMLMDIGRKGKGVLVSADDDILCAVKWLRGKLPRMRENTAGISPKYYLTRKFPEQESKYLIAAP